MQKEWSKTEEEAQVTEDRLEELIRQYRQSMRACASRTVNRFITESDEEWSVTLLAFREAVNTYKKEEGPFWPFAALLIKRRVTDFLRREYRQSIACPVSIQTLESRQENAIEEYTGMERETAACLQQQAMESDWPGKATIRDEIDALQEELAAFGFSFFDLTKASPRAEKTRKKCTEAAAALLQEPVLLQELFEKKRLPIGVLEKKSGVTRKILDKYRRYLITVCIILHGDYPQLAAYLCSVKEAMKQ